MYTIYYIYYPDAPKIGYIGLTKNLTKRIYDHQRHAKYKKSPLKDNWLLKYGITNFKVSVLESYLTYDQALAQEVFWIKTKKEDGYTLKNSTTGGEGTPGKVFTEAELARNREAHTVNTYVLIKDKHVFYVPYLRKWAFSLGYNPSHFYDLASGKHDSRYGYQCFKYTDWIKLTKDERKSIILQPIKSINLKTANCIYYIWNSTMLVKHSSIKHLAIQLGINESGIRKVLNTSKKYKNLYYLDTEDNFNLRQSRAKLLSVLEEGVTTRREP